MGIKARLWDNLFFMSLIHLYGAGAFRKEIALKRFIRRTEKIDSIENCEELKTAVDELLQKQYEYNCSTFRFEDTRFYGYYNALLEYSGYPNKFYPVITEIEHGIRFGQAHWPYFDYNTGYLCEGPERIHEISDENPYMPVTAVGPFVHYASQYYSEEKIRQIREQNGKTLLVFPGHSCEWVKDTRENDIVDIVFDKYADRFDTLMVCAYWRDLDSKELIRFREKGAKIVSAGFRQDKNFIRRLKTIISLSDEVIGNDIGTNMGFCLYLGKPFILEGECQVNPKDGLFSEYYRELYNAFSPGENGFSEKQLACQADIYRRFWGDDLIRSPEEIYRLFALFSKLLRKARFSISRYHALIRQEAAERKVLSPAEHELLLGMIKPDQGETVQGEMVHE